MSDIPICRVMCGSCPFRQGSAYTHLAPMLTQSAVQDASRICHSTGSNAIHERTGVPEHLCRGARDVQLQVFAALGFIATPTDAAWDAARVAAGFAPVPTQDPFAVSAKAGIGK